MPNPRAAVELLDSFLGALGLGDDEREMVNEDFSELAGYSPNTPDEARKTALSLQKTSLLTERYDAIQQNAETRAREQQEFLKAAAELRKISQEEYLTLATQNAEALEGLQQARLPSELKSYSGLVGLLGTYGHDIGASQRIEKLLNDSEAVQSHLKSEGTEAVILGVHQALDAIDAEALTAVDEGELQAALTTTTDPSEQKEILGQLASITAARDATVQDRIRSIEGLRVKKGVAISGMHESTVLPIRVMAAAIQAEGGKAVLTSGTERPAGRKGTPSFHPIGDGFDMGAKDFIGLSAEETQRGHALAKAMDDQLAAILGTRQFKVMYEDRRYKNGRIVRERHFHVQAYNHDADLRFYSRFGRWPRDPAPKGI